MRQAILLDTEDLRRLKQGGGLVLDLGGQSVTLFFARQAERAAHGNGGANGNGHRREVSPAQLAAIRKASSLRWRDASGATRPKQKYSAKRLAALRANAAKARAAKARKGKETAGAART